MTILKKGNCRLWSNCSAKPRRNRWPRCTDIVKMIVLCCFLFSNMYAQDPTVTDFTDINADGITNINDFLLLVGKYNQACICREDIDHNGVVNITDFLVLVGQFNTLTFPWINTVPSLPGFNPGSGLPSASQVLTVSGVRLTSALVITAPANYEISKSGENNYFTSITFPVNSGGALTNAIMDVRLSANASGNPAGNIVCSSAGVETKNIAVTTTSGPDNAYNYTRVQTVLKSGVTDETTVDGLPAEEMSQATQFLDGLGRPIQAVIKQGSPQKNDLVQMLEYDNQGRNVKTYLPYASVDGTGSFKPAVKTEQAAFYTSNPDPLIAQIPAAIGFTYAQTKFETSPLNRPLEQALSGNGIFGGHNQIISYRTNVAGEVQLWTYADDGTLTATRENFYAAATLYVTEVKDENLTKTVNFYNNSGNLITSKIYNSANVLLSQTYNVYDDFGQLRYTFSPEAVNKIPYPPPLANSVNILYGDNFMKNWAFSYVYDERHRLIEKRTPGAKSTMIVYDKLDRVVLIQDGNQRIKAVPEYTFIKYDVLSRPILTGTYADNRTIPNIQATMNTFALYESRMGPNTGVTSILGYSLNAFPTIQQSGYPFNQATFLTATYYDNYDFDADGTDDYSYVWSGTSYTPANFNRNTGQVTGSKTRILDPTNNNNWLTKALFYDNYGRMIQTRSNNHLNNAGTALDDSYNVAYDFSGNITSSLKIHSKNAVGPNLYVWKNYGIDHLGRLKAIYESEAFSPTPPASQVRLVEYKYNGLGQMIEKNLHSTDNINSLQSVDYRFNIKGWLTSINNSTLTNDGLKNNDANDLFGMELAYEATEAGITSTPRYNGDISYVKWKTNNPLTSTCEKTIRYGYDALNRITSGSFAEKGTSGSWIDNTSGIFNELFTYDQNGNMLTLQRKAATSAYMDNMTYVYTDASNDGNRLLKVTDAGDKATGFVEPASQSVNDYGYDDNGNKTLDNNKNITGITYNYLNLPEQITLTTGTIQFMYDAAGTKLRKIITPTTGPVVTTNYIDDFVYDGTTLQFFHNEEGRTVYSAGAFSYEYDITDHLGNVRLTFNKNTGTGAAQIIQENHYYAFGLKIEGNSSVDVGKSLSYQTKDNRFLYNYKELNKELALNEYDYGFRSLDPAIGRWHTQDPHADSYTAFSPYNYVGNSPANFIDPTGMDGESGNDPGSGGYGPAYEAGIAALGGSAADGSYYDDNWHLGEYLANQIARAFGSNHSYNPTPNMVYTSGFSQGSQSSGGTGAYDYGGSNSKNGTPNGGYLAQGGGLVEGPKPAQGGGDEYKNQYGKPSISLDDFRSEYNGKQENQIITGQSSKFGYSFPNKIAGNGSFVQLGNGREADMTHFMVVGRRGYTMGFINELTQIGTKSFFYPQDLYSNKLGINFFNTYSPLIQQKPNRISEYIYWYLSNPTNLK